MRRQAVILAAAMAWLVSIESAEAKLDILVDKATQRMLVMQNGYMRYIWPVSTGRDETATPSGVYAPQRMERNWFSNAYYNSPMPFSIFFHKGYAIHGSSAIDRLGGPASHGCVRLHPRHAELLFDMVQQEGPDQTTIEVTDVPGRGEPPLPGREIAAGRDLYPSVPKIVRYRETGEMPELPPARRDNRPIAVPGRDELPLPGREIAAGRDLYPPVPKIIRYRETGEMPELPPVRRDNRPIAVPGRDELPLPGREIAAGRDLYPPVPKIIRYRETGEMPELAPARHDNRPIAAKNAGPPRLPLPPPAAGRRMLSDARPSANVPRAPCGTGGDTANGSPRSSDESSDCRPKPRVAEAPSPEPAQQAQQAPSAFKLLPSSCWSGGASRWRWWASSQGPPCK
jgi:hypothetical protein